MIERREEVKKLTTNVSKRRKALMLGVNLSSCYIEKKPISQGTVELMNEIRDAYSKQPAYGYRRMTHLLKEQGHNINHKRVYRLMRSLGLKAVYPKKNLSKRRLQEAIYPYLLKDNPPLKPHDVWCVDITYIKTTKGYIYLVALIDAVSRCIMGFNVSTCLDTESCLIALEKAVESGFKPKIINSDQGCQFTSNEWVYQLKLLGVKISMDGKGRCLDNIPIERFWRTIKYEEVYLKAYESVMEAKRSIASYIRWYNEKRFHSALNYNKPIEVMMGLKPAKHMPFKKYSQQNVENSNEFTHNLLGPTATTKKEVDVEKAFFKKAG